MSGRPAGFVLDAPQAGCKQKPDAAFAPFLELGDHILGNENDPGGPADETVLARFGLRRDQREDGGAIGRRDCHPPVPGLQTGVKRNMETELIHVESQALVLIVDINVDGVHPEKGLLAVEPDTHGSDYTASIATP